MHRTLADTEHLNDLGLNGASSGGRASKAPANGNGQATGNSRESSSTGSLKIAQHRLKIRTLSEFDVIDITREVQRAIDESGIHEGYALVYSPHTTCAVLLNEKESGLLSDIKSTLCRLVPEQDGYLHDDFDVRTENMQEGETRNAHAHLRQVLAGKTSEYIPISEGSLLLGQWQRVMFVEFDCSRDREALIQICGI